MSIAQLEKMNEINHYPVMYREIIELLNVKICKIIVDCTLGIGSAACKILERVRSNAFYIGIDKDEESLNIAKQRMTILGKNFKLVKNDFSNLDKIFKELHVESADAFLFDLGISMYQLTSSERGFSFLKEGPLDMRMDRGAFVNAYDLVNNLSDEELENIFRKFGEERYCRRIARAIVHERQKDPITTTSQLAQIITRAVGAKSFTYRIHPATRIFQALRIAVNRELEVLRIAIDKAVSLLNPGGRIAIISFHSLEDRIVKGAFRNLRSQGVLNIITKKPIIPSKEEREENVSSRSAKLRVGEKI